MAATLLRIKAKNASSSQEDDEEERRSKGGIGFKASGVQNIQIRVKELKARVRGGEDLF